MLGKLIRSSGQEYLGTVWIVIIHYNSVMQMALRRNIQKLLQKTKRAEAFLKSWK